MESHEDFILKALSKQTIKHQNTPKYSTDELRAIIEKAKEELPPLFKALSQKYSFPVKRFSLTKAHSFWGICTYNNCIRLSVSVVTLPMELRRYIILHELVHTLHHNHSPRFHQKLNELLNGKEKEYIRMMKQYKTINFGSSL
ncbi:MAG: M48 family metallopeptidase [Alistipes sp.]|nr:M48 family metallopeptidase [Candidatus Alistipes equi]